MRLKRIIEIIRQKWIERRRPDQPEPLDNYEAEWMKDIAEGRTVSNPEAFKRFRKMKLIEDEKKIFETTLKMAGKMNTKRCFGDE